MRESDGQFQLLSSMQPYLVRVNLRGFHKVAVDFNQSQIWTVKELINDRLERLLDGQWNYSYIFTAKDLVAFMAV